MRLVGACRLEMEDRDLAFVLYFAGGTAFSDSFKALWAA